MKKISVVITAALYSAVAGALAYAQAPAPTKIAVINLEEAMARTKDGQEVTKKINDKFGPKKAEFDKRQKDVDDLTEKLNKGRATLSEEAQKTMAADIQRRATEVKRYGEDSQAEMNDDEGRATQELQRKIEPILTTYAAQNNYAIVIDVGQQSPVLWYASATNVTDIIIALYDQAHPVAGSPAAPATTPKPTPAPGTAPVTKK